MNGGGGPGLKIWGYGAKCGGKNGSGQVGGLYMKGLLPAMGLRGSWGGVLIVVGEVVESQKRLCFVSDVTVEKDCPHLTHLICIRQSACMRLWRQRLENWVYAWKSRLIRKVLAKC